MRKVTQYLACLMVVISLLGCRSELAVISTPAPIPVFEPTSEPTGAVGKHLPALSGAWRVTLTQSGGIMGMTRTVEVSPDGDMLFTDLRGGKTGQSSLSKDRLALLTKLVAASVYEPVFEPTGCADCFIFELSIFNINEKFQVQINQIDLQNSGLQPLVDFLIEELNGAVK